MLYFKTVLIDHKQYRGSVGAQQTPLLTTPYVWRVYYEPDQKHLLKRLQRTTSGWCGEKSPSKENAPQASEAAPEAPSTGQKSVVDYQIARR